MTAKLWIYNACEESRTDAFSDENHTEVMYALNTNEVTARDVRVITPHD